MPLPLYHSRPPTFSLVGSLLPPKTILLHQIMPANYKHTNLLNRRKKVAFQNRKMKMSTGLENNLSQSQLNSGRFMRFRGSRHTLQNISGCDNILGSDLLVPAEEELETVADTEHLTKENFPETEAELPTETVSNTKESVEGSATEENPTTQSHRSTNPVKHLERQTNQPNRLQYSQLGNPLVSIASSLFHRLRLASTCVLTETDLESTFENSSFPVMPHLPTSCKETCMFLREKV